MLTINKRIMKKGDASTNVDSDDGSMYATLQLIYVYRSVGR